LRRSIALLREIAVSPTLQEMIVAENKITCLLKGTPDELAAFID
jgi:hypothetical protein